MWQRFTIRARRIVFFAQEEAGKLGVIHVGPEHMLLGILRAEDSVAVKMLTTMSIDLEALERDLRTMTPTGRGIQSGDMQLTAEAKRSIDLSYEEAQRLNGAYIGTEHLLLGLIRDESGIAGKALLGVGVQLSLTRALLATYLENASWDEAWKIALESSDGKVAGAGPDARFTEIARQVIDIAKQEAANLGGNFYSTEHLLLALVLQPSELVTQMLDRLRVTAATIEDELRRQVVLGDGQRNNVLTPTPRVKRVFTIAHDASRKLADGVVGPEHLLIGLVDEAEGLAGRVLFKLGVNADNLLDAYTELRLDALEVELESESRLEGQLRSLKERLAALSPQPVEEFALQSSAVNTASPIFGDLGVASPADGRAHVEVAHDAAAFRRLIAVFIAKDAHGYRTLTEGDQTVFLLPAGTPLKCLVPPPDSDDVFEDGHFVRVLEGDYSGYAGWVFKTAFQRTGFDDAPFPPA